MFDYHRATHARRNFAPTGSSSALELGAHEKPSPPTDALVIVTKLETAPRGVPAGLEVACAEAYPGEGEALGERLAALA